jgi:hypothetical protein
MLEMPRQGSETAALERACILGIEMHSSAIDPSSSLLDSSLSLLPATMRTAWMTQAVVGALLSFSSLSFADEEKTCTKKTKCDSGCCGPL